MDLKSTFHSINLKRKSYFDSVLSTYHLNMMELEILVFLAENPESNTFTEIQKSKDYAKSHVSMAVNHLIETGYLTKTQSPNNKKIFYLQANPQSKTVVSAYNTAVTQFRTDAFHNIPPQDIQTFEQVLDKIYSNMLEEPPCKP